MKNNMTDYSRQVLTDVSRLSADDVYNLHGIRINDDSTIYDEAYNKTFATIEDWIQFSSNDQDSAFEKFGYSGEHEFY